MKESELILHLLFPAHEETSRAVHPTVRPLHHPAPGTVPRDELFLALLFPPAADVRLIVACDQFLVDWSGVVGSIQTEVLRLLRRGLGSADQQAIQRGT